MEHLLGIIFEIIFPTCRARYFFPRGRTREKNPAERGGERFAMCPCLQKRYNWNSGGVNGLCDTRFERRFFGKIDWREPLTIFHTAHWFVFKKRGKNKKERKGGLLEQAVSFFVIATIALLCAKFENHSFLSVNACICFFLFFFVFSLSRVSFDLQQFCAKRRVSVGVGFSIFDFRAVAAVDLERYLTSIKRKALAVSLSLFS